MKLSRIQEEFKIGDIIILFLTNGSKEEGTIISMNQHYIKLKTLTQALTFFNDIIGG